MKKRSGVDHHRRRGSRSAWSSPIPHALGQSDARRDAAQIVPVEDDELAKVLGRAFEKQGIAHTSG